MAIVNAGTARTLSPHPADHTNYSAMAMVTTLFFAWGFCTVLNDAVIPHLQSVFDLSYVQASLIQLAFFSSYFVFALPAGKLVEWIGYQRTMVVGLVLMASGALLFVPAASVATYAFFLCAEVVLAAGVTVLQVAANGITSLTKLSGYEPSYGIGGIPGVCPFGVVGAGLGTGAVSWVSEGVGP